MCTSNKHMELAGDLYYDILRQISEFVLLLAHRLRLWPSIRATLAQRWNIFVKTMETKGVFQFKIIINALLGSFRFIWIGLPMLWVYGHYNFRSSLSVGIVFRRQILTSKDHACLKLNLVLVSLLTCLTGKGATQNINKKMTQFYCMCMLTYCGHIKEPR